MAFRRGFALVRADEASDGHHPTHRSFAVDSKDSSNDSGGAYEETTLAADPHTLPKGDHEPSEHLERGETVDCARPRRWPGFPTRMS